MRLSKLVFLAIKNVNYFDDSSMTYNNFMSDFLVNKDNYTDYSVAVMNVFTPLNEAIQRLSDLNKIPYKVKELDISNNVVELTSDIKEVISVATLNNERLPFAPYGVGKIRVLRSANNKVLVEYKEEIPSFEIEDIMFVDNDNDTTFDEITDSFNEKDIELSSVGINGAMNQYIIEYCQGKLEEQVDPVLASKHLTIAEQYFANLKDVRSGFTQEVVRTKYGLDKEESNKNQDIFIIKINEEE